MIDAKTGYERRWRALALLAMTQFLVILDITIVNIALPSIRTSLGFSEEGLQWVADAYMLTFGGFLLLGGRAADLFGRRRMFVTGLLVFGLASLTCGLSQNSGMLIAARAVQGLGGAFLAPAALSLVMTIFTDGGERNKAMGIWGAVAGAGGATGNLLGGVLTDGPGWRWVFWVAVPFALIGALLTPRLVAETEAVPGGRHFDLLGAVSITAGLSALIYGLVEIEQKGAGSAQALIPIAAAVLLLALFVVVEQRTEAPLVPFRIFRSRVLSAANATMLLFAAGVVAMSYFVSLYLQQVLHYSPFKAGLSFLPMALGQIVFAQVTGKLLGRFGIYRVLIVGLLLSTAGFAWFGFIRPNGTFLVDILGPSVVLSLGGALTFVAVVVSAMNGVQPQDAGLAGGLVNMSQQVGGALGLAGLSTLAVWKIGHVNPAAAGSAGPLTDGFRLGLLIGAVMCAVAAIVAGIAMRGAFTPPPAAPVAPEDDAALTVS